MTHIRQPREYTDSLPRPNLDQLQTLARSLSRATALDLTKVNSFLIAKQHKCHHAIVAEADVPALQEELIAVQAYLSVVQDEIIKRNNMGAASTSVLTEIGDILGINL